MVSAETSNQMCCWWLCTIASRFTHQSEEKVGEQAGEVVVVWTSESSHTTCGLLWGQEVFEKHTYFALKRVETKEVSLQ